MGKAEFSIVIPTRDRHRTLRYAIESALANPGDSLEVVVMDNLSSPETKAVVDGFSDARLRYFVAPRRLAMSDNWELGLERASGQFVFVLGDDDAALPNLVAKAKRILDDTGAEVLSWRRCSYWWPDAIVPWQRNRLYVPLRGDIWNVDARAQLRTYFASETSYGELPSLYGAFVHRRVLDAVRRVHGRYFMSAVPDVYSGIVNAYFAKSWFHSTIPLSVSGVSGASTGCSYLHRNRDSGPVEQWERENATGDFSGDTMHASLVPSQTLEMRIADCNVKTKELFFPNDDALGPSMVGVIGSLLGGMTMRPERWDEYQRDILALARKHGIAIPRDAFPARSKVGKTPKASRGLTSDKPDELQIAIDAEAAGISDCAAAARLSAAMLPE